MRTTQRSAELGRLRLYDRAMLRSMFSSLMWSAIMGKRKEHKLTLVGLANALSVDKSVISRWFAGRTRPNWQVNTIADLAHVLDLEIEVTARDRSTGIIYTAAGPAKRQQATTGSEHDAGQIRQATPPVSATFGDSTSDRSYPSVLIAA